MKYIVQFLLSSYKPNGKYFKYHVTNVNKNAARDKFAKQLVLGFFQRRYQKFTSTLGSGDHKTRFNTLKPRQNGRHFPDYIFKYIFLNENIWIWIKISLKFVSKGSINNIPVLVAIMAWSRPGDKLLSELMMDNLPTHICVTWPQWVNSDYYGGNHIAAFVKEAKTL